MSSAIKEDRKLRRHERIGKIEDNEPVLNILPDAEKNLKNEFNSQILKNIVFLEKNKCDSLEIVSEIKLQAESFEKLRRSSAISKLRDRMLALKEETIESTRANLVIEEKWSSLLKNDVPQDLYKELKHQLDSCKTMLNLKDTVLNGLRNEVRDKDNEFVEVLRQQESDIDDLVQRIDQSCTNAQKEYENQLKIIETVFQKEQQSLIDNHKEYSDSILSKRKEKENYFFEEKMKRDITHQNELDNLVAKGTDDYNKLKTELESNIQILNQQLEEIKATYQLNSEKLEYSYRVLTELDSEKLAEREKLKRKAGKIKDNLNVAISKYHELDVNYLKSSSELVEDYRELTKRYKDLQAKLKHFELADTTKYRQVWLMHQQELKSLIQELLEGDKIITQNYLKLEWKPPPFHDSLFTDGDNIDASRNVSVDLSDEVVNDESSKNKLIYDCDNYWSKLSSVVSDETIESWKHHLKDNFDRRKLLYRRNRGLSEIQYLTGHLKSIKLVFSDLIEKLEVESSFQVSPALTLILPQININKRLITPLSI